MAEEKPPSRVRAWMKAIITSIMGLCSGAVLMYVSPLVNNAIKPAKPFANFGHLEQGLAVTFQNKATGATDGWWDFGDGSPLEPFSPTQDSVTHTYARATAYTVKLSLRNFLGDENERTATVDLGGVPAAPPVIEAFKVESLKPEATAPATFKVASQIKNADLCIWSLGDDRPLEVSSDTSTNQERYVTIKEPGFYTLKLVAVSGKQTVEKAEAVFVNVGDSNAASATLQVAVQAIPIQKLTKEVNLHVAFPADNKERTFPFTLTHVEPDYQIADAKFTKPAKESGVANPVLTISPDKAKVMLSGQLVKPGGLLAWQKNQVPIRWTPTVVLSLERRSAMVNKTFDPIATNLTVPGTTLLPLPKLSSRWEIKGTTLNLEVRDGAKVLYKDAKLPVGTMVQIKNQLYRLSATLSADGIRLELMDAKATAKPALQ
jgi:hypothetical protein